MLREAVPAAVARAAKEMIEPALGEFQGLPALRKFAAEVGSWPEAAEDWQWCARFLFQVIERRGTGGGNFRAMYSRFLDEAGYGDEAPLAAEASERWTALAEAAANGERERRGRPGASGPSSTRRAEATLEAETALWEALACLGRLGEPGEVAEAPALAALELEARRRGAQPHRLAARRSAGRPSARRPPGGRRGAGRGPARASRRPGRGPRRAR